MIAHAQGKGPHAMCPSLLAGHRRPPCTNVNRAVQPSESICTSTNTATTRPVPLADDVCTSSTNTKSCTPYVELRQLGEGSLKSKVASTRGVGSPQGGKQGTAAWAASTICRTHYRICCTHAAHSPCYGVTKKGQHSCCWRSTGQHDVAQQ